MLDVRATVGWHLPAMIRARHVAIRLWCFPQRAVAVPTEAVVTVLQPKVLERFASKAARGWGVVELPVACIERQVPRLAW